jgi:hypothetical protein
MRIPDYVALGVLIALAVWAAADLIPQIDGLERPGVNNPTVAHGYHHMPKHKSDVVACQNRQGISVTAITL